MREWEPFQNFNNVYVTKHHIRLGKEKFKKKKFKKKKKKNYNLYALMSTEQESWI